MRFSISYFLVVVILISSSFSDHAYAIGPSRPNLSTQPIQLPSEPLSPPSTKVAFVLSGGGAKGSFEIGVLRKLYEVGIKPDIIAGTSVGAINSVKLAEGKNQSFPQLWNLWMNMRNTNDMWTKKPIMERIEELMGPVNLFWFRARGASDYVWGTVFYPFIFINNIIDVAGKCRDAQELASDIPNEKSLYSLQPIRTKLTNNLDLTQISESEITLRLAAVNLASGETCYANEQSQLCCKEECSSVNLIDATMASASIPVFFEPVKMNDNYFVDGGVRDVVPLVEVTQELEATTTFVILASPLQAARGYNFSGPDPDFGLFDVALRSVDLLVNEVFVNDLMLAVGLDDWSSDVRNYFEKDIYIVAPMFEVHSTLEIDPYLIRYNSDYGWLLAADMLMARTEKNQSRRLWTEGFAETFSNESAADLFRSTHQITESAMRTMRYKEVSRDNGASLLILNLMPSLRREKLYNNAANLIQARVDALMATRHFFNDPTNVGRTVSDEGTVHPWVLNGTGIEDLRSAYREIARLIVERRQLSGELPSNYESWVNPQLLCTNCKATGTDPGEKLSSTMWIWAAYPHQNIPAEDPPEL